MGGAGAAGEGIGLGGGGCLSVVAFATALFHSIIVWPNATPTDPTFAGVALVDFRGRATFLSTIFGTRVLVAGNGEGTNVMLMGIQPSDENLFASPPTKASVAVLYSRRFAQGEPPTRSVPNQGNPDAAWILQMLEQVRTDTPHLLTTLRADLTDLRFYRVTVFDFSTGIEVKR